MEVASNGSTNPEDNPVDNIFLNQTFSILPELNFISFAYYYFVENGLYAGCKNNKIPLKLWNKECFMSDEDVKYRMKIIY